MSENALSKEPSLEEENQTLKVKIDELERTISEIELKSQINHKKRSAYWWEKVLFAAILFFCAIPAYFVVADRWFGERISIPAVDQLWWNILPLREIAYPRYFLIIFFSVLFAELGVFFWRTGPTMIFSNLSLGKRAFTPESQVDERHQRIGHYLIVAAFITTNISAGFMLLTGRIPGWELLSALAIFICGQIIKEYPLTSIKLFFRELWRLLVDTAIFIINLCCLLYNVFGESERIGIFAILFVFASINFLRHKKEIPAVLWVSMLALVALTWKIDGWEYVVIGDEYSFFSEVHNILQNRTAWELINLTFNGNFVYGTHPYFSSYIHYFFMKIFGNHNFGWRFSNPVLVASSIFFYFYFFKTFIPRRTALITVIMIGASHYLLSFSKIGYNNLQAFFALGLVLATMAWALKSLKVTAFSLLGFTIGICFYLYPASLYITPLPFLGMLIFFPPKNKERLKRWGWTVASFALLFYPLIAQPRYWETKIAGTFFYTDVSNSAGALLENILHNVLYSSLSFLYIPEQSHYVSTGYMDPVSSVFIVIGIACLGILVHRRNKSALFLGLSFAWMFFIAGATHGRNFPTTTRMFLLLPWFALFAAFGLEWCTERATSFFTIHRKNIISFLMGLIVITNLYNAYVIDIMNMAQYHSLAPMFIKIVREIEDKPYISPKIFAFVAPPGWDISGMELIQKAYLVPNSPRQLINLPVEGDHLPESAVQIVSNQDFVIIVKADIDDNIKAQVGTQLQNWGKSMCEIRNEKASLQFQLWHSGDLAWLCQ